MHPICPPKFCITFVSLFSWVSQPFQEKLKTMLMQNFGSQTRCIMGDGQVANRLCYHEAAQQRQKNSRVFSHTKKQRMLTNVSGVEFQRTVLKFRKSKRNSSPCLHVLHKTWNWAVSHRSRAVTAIKCPKKRDARAKLLFCLSKPVFFFVAILVAVAVAIA